MGPEGIGDQRVSWDWAGQNPGCERAGVFYLAPLLKRVSDLPSPQLELEGRHGRWR